MSKFKELCERLQHVAVTHDREDLSRILEGAIEEQDAEARRGDNVIRYLLLNIMIESISGFLWKTRRRKRKRIAKRPVKRRVPKRPCK